MIGPAIRSNKWKASDPHSSANVWHNKMREVCSNRNMTKCELRMEGEQNELANGMGQRFVRNEITGQKKISGRLGKRIKLLQFTWYLYTVQLRAPPKTIVQKLKRNKCSVRWIRRWRTEKKNTQPRNQIASKQYAMHKSGEWKPFGLPTLDVQKKCK